MKRYALICTDFGRKFSFLAKDELDAKHKMNNWIRYHSFSSIKSNFSVEEIDVNDPKNDLESYSALEN